MWFILLAIIPFHADMFDFDFDKGSTFLNNSINTPVA